jgi:hypothetical protein
MTVEYRFVERQLAELLQAQLRNSATPLDRSRLLEGLIRLVYEHVKFQTPDGMRMDDPERNGVSRVLASAANHVHLSRQAASAAQT